MRTPRARAQTPSTGISRRQLLLGGAAAGVGAGIGLAADAWVRSSEQPQAAPGDDAAPLTGQETIAFFGATQAGLTVRPQAHSTFVGFDLLPEVDAAGLRRMMMILSDDAARLTQGNAALADSEPELSTIPARLTITFGFGRGFVERANPRATPDWLAPLPAFTIDQLEDRFSEGDLLIEVAADDPLTVSHALRMLTKDARSFARPRWTHRGFRRARGSEPNNTTMRNLFGQVDGTVNLHPDDPDFDRLVIIRDGWLAGGSSLVIRKIAMDLNEWDRLDRPGREQSVGRTLANGAPLTGTVEHDEPDFDAKSPIGFPVIPEFSHIRRARSDNTDERFYRRGYNYEKFGDDGDEPESGLIFTSFQADVLGQFVPIQRRLDELDLLNQWTIPVGSSVFAIPPGCEEGSFIGDTLLQ
ncbi:Dyp-type peroxidase [Humidisolicoccus flavus]|uniref:Dyp-type peroxidase n=1 Tax=Humidisolicoccus flavus TaxID=3111414 RepID=UPI00324D1141